MQNRRVDGEALDSKRWRLRDYAAAAGLFLATALWVLWQNSRVAVLWDLGYLLNTSHRMAAGQVPYRDFSLVHPPLTFLIQAVIERIFGRHYECVIAYAAIAGGIASVIAWRIVLYALRGGRFAWLSSLMLAVLLPVLGIYSVYPYPVYDSDAVLAVLVAILVLQRADAAGEARWYGATVGVAVVLPLFFKQNIGLPFLLAVLGGLALMCAMSLRKISSGSKSVRQPLFFLAQIFAALAVGVIFVQGFFGPGNYLQWTMRFAAERRLPGAGSVLSIYQEPALHWALPLVAVELVLLCTRLGRLRWAQMTGAALIAAPFLVTLVYLFFERDPEDRADRLLVLWPLILVIAAVVAFVELRKGVTLTRLVPFFVLAAIHGTFLSQEIWGSSYAIWPLLLVLVAYLLAALPERAWSVVPALTVVIGMTFLVCGGLYAASLERLNYIYNPEDQPLVKATLPALRGMAARGPYLPDFEQLVRFADAEIPAGDGVVLLPGEEPFFYATGRVPRFPAVLFDHTTDPYSPEELMAEAARRGIRWMVVKTRLQSNEDPLEERERLMQLVQERYRLYRKLDGYDVYRR